MWHGDTRFNSNQTTIKSIVRTAWKNLIYVTTFCHKYQEVRNECVQDHTCEALPYYYQCCFLLPRCTRKCYSLKCLEFACDKYNCNGFDKRIFEIIFMYVSLYTIKSIKPPPKVPIGVVVKNFIEQFQVISQRFVEAVTSDENEL